MDRCPAGHERRAVLLLVLVEARAIHDPRQHLAHVERNLEVVGDDPEQVVCRMQRWVGLPHRAVAEFRPFEVGHDHAADPQAVVFVLRQVVGKAGHLRMHLCAAEFFVCRHLAGGHLDQRWPSEEHLGPLLDHDRVVRHTGHISAAGRRATEDEGDVGDAESGELGLVAEPLAAGDEHVCLGSGDRLRPIRPS